MKTFRSFLALPFSCILAILFLSPTAWPQPAGTPVASAPAVRKIDPPNWWTHFTLELTLLLTGENLNGARVESTTKDLTVLGSDASANGHYLFVRLKLGSALHAGNAQLRLHTSSGATAIQFPLLARAGAPGDFQGFSRDDVIYLIMPDRFADGDPSNDQPPGSTGVYDRSKPTAYHGGDLRGSSFSFLSSPAATMVLWRGRSSVNLRPPSGPI